MKINVIKIHGDNNFALTANGFLAFALDANDEEVESLKEKIATESRKSKIDNNNNSENCFISIMPTFDCNLQCCYCYANAGSTKEIIKFEYAKKGIDYVRENNKSDYLDLYLVGGGEPLLYFDLVKEIVLYSETKFQSVFVKVVTNGTFNEKILYWLYQKNANIRVSYDGIGHDFARPFKNGNSSRQIVRENIKRLIELELDPCIQCIVTSESIDYLRNTVDDLLELGVKIVKFEPAHITDVSRGEKSVEPNPILYANKLLEVVDYIKENNLPIQIDSGYFSKPMEGNYCGIVDNFTITPHGLITSCVEVARASDPYADSIIIGNIGKQLNIKRNDYFFDGLDLNKRTDCSICNLNMICLGGCPMANIWRNGLPIKKSNYTCVLQHELLPKLLYRIALSPIYMNILMEQASRKEV